MSPRKHQDDDSQSDESVDIEKDEIDFKGLKGKDAVDAIERSIKRHDVFFVSKSTCPFCLETKRTFKAHNIPYTVVDVDTLPNGSDIQKAGKEVNGGHGTTPMIWIKGEWVGGCNQLKEWEAEGKLSKLKGAHRSSKAPAGDWKVDRGMHRDQEKDSKVVKTEFVGRHVVLTRQDENTLVESEEWIELKSASRDLPTLPRFAWFPHTVNHKVIRCTGVITSLLCIVLGALNDKFWTHVGCVFLAIDFTLRLLFGGTASPIGTLSMVLTSGMKEDLRPGPPKQFAALCGFSMAVTAAILFYVDSSHQDDTYNWVAAAVLFGLAGASGMEGFIDFCLGCWIFGVLIRFGLLHGDVYRIHLNSKVETQYTIEEMDKVLNLPVPEVWQTVLPNDGPTAIDLRYKAKTDDHTRESNHWIKYVDIQDFGMPLAIFALAMLLRSAFVTGLGGGVWKEDYWKVFAFIGAAWFTLFFVLYLLKLVIYPKKVRKEWFHAAKGNLHGLIPMNLIFCALLTQPIDTDSGEDDRIRFAEVLVWMGAPIQVLLTTFRIASWIRDRHSEEHFNPTMLVPAVSGLVSSLGFSVIAHFEDDGSDYLELAWFCFGFSFVMMFVIIAYTFGHGLTYHWSDDRIRPSTALWLAAPSMAYTAAMTLSSQQGLPAFESTLTGKVLFHTCQSLFLILLVLGGTSFLFNHKFDQSYWLPCFSLSAFAFAVMGQLPGIYYDVLLNILLFVNLVWVTVGMLSTIFQIIKRRYFRATQKWGPLSFMRLTHEAFRGAIAELESRLDALDADSDVSIDAVVDQVRKFCLLHDAHSGHEDDIIFKTFDDYFPEQPFQWNDDHDRDHEIVKELRHLCADLENGKNVEKACDAIKSTITDWLPHLEEHFVGEETHLQPVGRKHVPLETQKSIVRQVWEYTPVNEWRLLLPFIVSSQRIPMQRTRIVKCFIWAMPEKAQLIGQILFRGVDDVTWTKIADEVPEVIPRGHPGWVRYY